MKKIWMITVLALLGILALAYYFCIEAEKKKQAEEAEAEGESNFAGVIEGGGMFLGAILLLGIVLLGTAFALVVFGAGWTAKKVATDPDKSIDRTIRLSEAYRNIRGGSR